MKKSLSSSAAFRRSVLVMITSNLFATNWRYILVSNSMTLVNKIELPKLESNINVPMAKEV